MAHRLELAIKDALKSTAFDLVDEMLLRLYLLYENSPKKCRELEDICSEVSQCLSLDSEDGGTKPIRASGLCWVTHKWNAMKRILSKYGAYTSHFATLSEDPLVRTANRAKLKGHYNKWVDAKYLSSLFKSIKEIDKLSSTPITQWLTYASTISKCSTNDTNTVYQTQNLKCYDEAKSYFTNYSSAYCSKISDCVKSWLAWTDLELLRDIFVPASQGWHKIVDNDEDLEAINRLAEHFKISLEKANTMMDEIHTEFKCIC